MSQHLFVYGTLQPDCAPPEIADAAAKLWPMGKASVVGDLYDMGGFPGAVLGDGTENLIHGTLFELPDDGRILRELDAYEEYDETSPETSLFLRVKSEAKLSTGETLPCWLYVYAQGRTGAPRIQDGRWPHEAN